MIDLHAHILPNLDDGAKTIDESIQMCQKSYDDGVGILVATPHILPGVYRNSRSTILTKVQELNEALKECGMSNSECGIRNVPSEIPACGRQAQSAIVNQQSAISHPQSAICDLRSAIKILPGADVHFSPDLLQLYEKQEIVTVNDDGRYLMVEFDFQSLPYRGEEVLFQLITHGIIPIITHPERNLEIARSPKRYYEMIKMGCLGQVTAMSLTGEFGSDVKRVAERLLAHQLIHFIASDTHSVDGRPPILSTAVRKAEKIVGKEEAIRMVTEYPRAILDGERPDVPEPLPI